VVELMIHGMPFQHLVTLPVHASGSASSNASTLLWLHCSADGVQREADAPQCEAQTTAHIPREQQAALHTPWARPGMERFGGCIILGTDDMYGMLCAIVQRHMNVVDLPARIAWDYSDNDIPMFTGK
jgi:hypothetical protein